MTAATARLAASNRLRRPSKPHASPQKAASRSTSRKTNPAPRERNSSRVGPSIPMRNPAALHELFMMQDTTTAGIYVDNAKAMTIAGVYRAVSIVADMMASMTLKVYKEDESGDRTEAKLHPSFRLMSISPDDIHTAFMFRETMVMHAILAGNAYAEIVRNLRGQAIELHLLNPNQVTIKWERSQPFYYVQRDSGPPDRLDRSQMLHLASLSWDGFEGRSLVSCARESFGLTLAAEKFGASFYGKGGRPLGFLKRQTKVTDTQREKLLDEWNELHGGSNNYWNVGVLSGGWEWEGIGIGPKDAEFLLTRQFQLRDVARWVGVPPHMLGDSDKTSYSDPEHMMIEFLTLTLMPWAKRFENELRMKLFTRVESLSYYAEHNMDSLLRADSKTQAEISEIEIRNAIATVNEVRRRKNRTGYENAGNKPLILASQLATLEQAETGELASMRMGGNTNNEDK